MLPPMANNSRHHPQGVLRSKARPRFSRVPKRPTAQWEARDAETASDAEIAGLDLVVCAQFFGLGRIDHLALAHHMHVGRTQTSVLPLLDCRRPARIRYVRQTTPAMWLSAGRGLRTEPEPFTPETVGFLTFRFCSQWRCRPTNGGAPFLKAFPGTFGCACDCRSRSCSCGGF